MDNLGERVSQFFGCCITRENRIFPVREIDLSHQRLGEVPSSIFLFERSLEILNLSCNKIYDLRTSLFKCQNLTELNLSDNRFILIPPAIGQLSNLRSLDMSKNFLDTVPATITRCKNLTQLNLNACPLRTLPDAVTQVVSLEELHLCGSEMYFLPANIGRLEKLRILELRDNRLSSLPPALHRCSQIRFLDLGQNDFNVVPNRVADLHLLEELYLDLNGMENLPEFIGGLKNLNHLDANDNRLKVLPKEIGECTNLAVLCLSCNDISRLPETFGDLSNLVTLRLSNNQLSSLPMSFGYLRSLEEVDLSENRLEDLPPTIGLLRKLRIMILDNNDINYLPSELGSCRALGVLHLANNKLKVIPYEIGHLLNLTVLNLIGNDLSFLPTSILFIEDKLKALWLVANQSNPKITFLRTNHPTTRKAILTCYLLPQRKSGVLLSDVHAAGPSSMQNRVQHQGQERPRIRFSLNAANDLDISGALMRVPTPYPRRMRELARTARALGAYHVEPLPLRPILGAYHAEPVLAPDSNVVNVDIPPPSVPLNVQRAPEQVRRAIVKRKSPPHTTTTTTTSTVSESSEISTVRQPQPPPYHVALLSSNKSVFQPPTPRRVEPVRSDVDSDVLDTLKDELMAHIRNIQESQSEQSVNLDVSERSEADSAFIEPLNHPLWPVHSAQPPTSRDGTYAALPGIVTQEADASNSNVNMKVSNWLRNRTRDPHEERGQLNMFPLEQQAAAAGNAAAGDNAAGKQAAGNVAAGNNAAVDNTFYKAPLGEDYLSEPMYRLFSNRWMFGPHRNPVVFEIIVIRSLGEPLGFQVGESSSPGAYVVEVQDPLVCAGLQEWDKILTIDGNDVQHESAEYIQALLESCTGPVQIMISRKD